LQYSFAKGVKAISCGADMKSAKGGWWNDERPKQSQDEHKEKDVSSGMQMIGFAR